MIHPQYPRSSSGMRGGRNNNGGMSSQQHNAGNGMAHDNTRRNRSSSRSKPRSRSKSLGRRQNGTGQSSLSAHIQQQMEARPRRGERDPTPLSRSAHNKSAPGLNYNGQAPPQQQFSSPPRRNSAAMPRRIQSSNNVDDLSPSSSEERAAIAANLAKNSFSAHQNLQKLIDEQREREFHRMDHHAQQNMMQVYHPMHPQNQQMQVYHPQHLQQEQQYNSSAPSSVAAVHEELPQHQTPLKLMVGQDGFARCSVSAMTPLTPSTVELESNNAALSSPDVVGQGYIPRIRRVTDNAGRNGGYNHRDQHQQQQLEPRRRSASPKRPNRDHLNVVPRQPNFDEEQLNAIAAEHPDLELAQSIAKIMAFQRKSSAQGGPSQSRQIVSYDDDNGEHPPRKSKSQLRMDTMDKNDSSEIKNEKVARSSFFSNSTAPTAMSSLNSGSLFASSEPSSNNHNSSSFQTPPNTSTSKPPQIQRQNSLTPRYLDKDTLYNHLQDAPRESRVQLTRLIENLQSENQRLNELTMTQGNQIDKLESEIGGLLRELLRYRREFGEMTTVAEGAGSEGDVSSEHATAATPTPSAVGMSSPSRQAHSSSWVGTVRQDSITQIKEDEELDVVPPYVKSKSLHEEVTDRQRRTPADKRRSSSSAPITSAPILSSPSSGASSKGSFDHKMDMLRKFQLTSPSSLSNSGDNDSRTRRSYSDRTADDSFHTAVESIFDPNVSAKQRSFKEEKKADTEATLRWGGMRDVNDEHDDHQIDGEGSIDEEQLGLMHQQREQDENHQDEVTPETRLRSNSLEDVFEPESRRSCFVEQKGGSTSSGSVSGSVPSMTDTVGSCSWSYSTPESGGER